jgi:tRNA (guanosine-2'-O-)-methyltransferase
MLKFYVSSPSSVTTAANLIKKYGEEAICRLLALHLTEERINRIETVINGRVDSVQVAVEDPADMHNALAIIRTAEALGVRRMHAIGWPIRKNRGIGITRGSQNWTETIQHKSLPDFLESKNDFKIAGACVERGKPLSQLPIDEPLILLFGNEHSGLTDQAKDACDYLYTIPMYGMIESFNLSVAAGISLFDQLTRRRTLLQTSGDLDAKTTINLRASYTIAATGTEKARQILDYYNSPTS